MRARCSKSLSHLFHCITENGIDHKGAKAIAEALQANGSLQQLSISGILCASLFYERFISYVENDIGEKGAKAIAEALQSNASIHQLDLGCALR